MYLKKNYQLFHVLDCWNCDSPFAMQLILFMRGDVIPYVPSALQ
jgi:hypothetical protein